MTTNAAAAAPKGAMQTAYRALEIKQNRYSSEAGDPFVLEALKQQQQQQQQQQQPGDGTDTEVAKIARTRARPPLKLVVAPPNTSTDIRGTIDKLSAGLQLVLSGGRERAPRMDYNLLNHYASEIALAFTSVQSEPSALSKTELLRALNGSVLPIFHLWMAERGPSNLRLFDALVMRPSVLRSGPADKLYQLQEFLLQLLPRAEREQQWAELFAQILQPLMEESTLDLSSDWPLASMGEWYHSVLGDAVKRSFTVLFELGLRSPVVEAPMLLYTFPGVLNVRWGQDDLPSFLRVYIRFRCLRIWNGGRTSSFSLLHGYVGSLPAFYQRLAPRIMARCKVETSTLVKPRPVVHKASQLAPRSEESDDAIPPPEEPQTMEANPCPSSLPSKMDRTNAAALYANWARGVLEFETNLAFIVLGKNKHKVRALLAEVIHQVVDLRFEELAQSFSALLNSNSWYDLNVLYSLASPMPKVTIHLRPEDQLAPAGDSFSLLAPDRSEFEPRKIFLQEFRAFVEDKTGAIVSNDKDVDMIPDLLQLWRDLSKAVNRTFVDQSGEFLHALRDGFEAGIAKRETKPAEMLAKHLDVLLRKSPRSMTGDQLEEALNDSLLLFRFIKDKDVFEEFYTRYFAKRLLLNKSASSDAEASMLLKLKSTCGAEFTRRLETMLKDIAVSDDMVASWEMYAKNSGQDLGLDVAVTVLTQAHWPSYPVHPDVRLPRELERATELFEQFYSSRNQGRTLRWQHNLGMNCVVAHLPNKQETRELVVSTYQALVLLLFNERYPLGTTGAMDKRKKVADGEAPPYSLSYAFIAERTRLPPDELDRVLQSLASGPIPTRVLRKHPQGKDVAPSDVFTLNENLKNERLRIRINQIQLKDTVEEHKQTERQVFLERDIVIQAAVVRILKAEKTVSHNDLLQAVIKAISSRFTVDVSEIKRAFAALVDKDYMERVKEHRNVYRYIA